MSRTLRQHIGIGSWHVPMVTDYYTHPAVQIITNNELLTTEIAMEIYNGRHSLVWCFISQNLINSLQGIIDFPFSITADNLAHQTY